MQRGCHCILDLTSDLALALIYSDDFTHSFCVLTGRLWTNPSSLNALICKMGEINPYLRGIECA